MADPTSTEPATEPASTEPATPNDLGEPGQRALAAERTAARQAKRERDALAAELQQMKDRDLTEQQRLERTATTASARVTELEQANLKLTVAFEKGLTPAQAKRLIGATRDELEADADDLLQTFTQAPADPALALAAAQAAGTAALAADLGGRGTATIPLNGSPIEDALRRAIGA